MENLRPPATAFSFFYFFFVGFFFIPFHLWGRPLQATAFGVTPSFSRRNRHNQRQSKSYQLSQGPRAPAEVTLLWLTSRIPAVNQRRVTDSGCSAPSHRSSWGCGGIIAKMKTVMVYRLPTLRPFTGGHDGNDKRSVGRGSLRALLIKCIALHARNSERLQQRRPLRGVVLLAPPPPPLFQICTNDRREVMICIFTSCRHESESCARLGQRWSRSVPT